MFQRVIEVAGRVISEEAPAFVVAEAACNHMCDLKTAFRMVDEAKRAGADAIKFQTYKADRLVVQNAESYWKTAGGNTLQYAYYKNLDRFDRPEYEKIFSYANEKGLIAFSTPFDGNSASMLNELGVPLFKIASCDLPDVRLLRHVASFGKPVILSTGASALAEIEEAVDTLGNAGTRSLVLLVCTMSYPAANQDAHLRRILTLKRRFPDLIVGISDHTEPDPHMIIPAVAVALGAKVIEKHFTLDRSMAGSGHSFSVSPVDLQLMVENIRLCEAVLGDPTIRVHEVEQPGREKARRSLVAQRAIQPGERITDEMIGVKRPGTGLSPAFIDQVIGRRAKRGMGYDEPIGWEKLCDREPPAQGRPKINHPGLQES